MEEGKSDPFGLSMFSRIGVGSTTPKVDPDPVREKREAERRERLGQLRARPHPAGRRHNRIEQTFG
jgi:hypothetical protein